jgi:hypothetical protein
MYYRLVCYTFWWWNGPDAKLDESCGFSHTERHNVGGLRLCTAL